AMREYILVEKDLISTQKYVTEVIDRAIESAIELDRWTEQRLNNLTAKTNNKLTIGSNVLIEVSNDIANENVKVNSANGFLLEQINKILASIQPYPVSSGGAGVPSERGYGVKYEGDIYEAETYVPGPDGTEAKASILMSFGLLNLIDETNLDNFLNERFGKDLALYVAALNHIDPFVPGGSINYTTTVDKTTIAPHLCSSIDSTGQDCYSGTLDTSQIADSTSITKASDSAEASGIESDGGNPAGTDITTTSAPMITSYDKAVVPDELTPIPIGLKNADTNGNIIYTDLPDVIPIRPIKGSDITDDAFELSDDEVIIPSWNYDLDPIDVDIISCPTN
ncbi:hypothetical protein KKF38_01945, partial [Patescibacteria group bacterium]|nr:hypothetical protein [Patescibacteria group bacterium]